MRKQLLAALLLASATTGAVYAQTGAGTAVAPATGKPKLGDFGVDLTAMDRAVAPGDDFYNYVNGAWMARTEIPADRSSWGGFAILRDLSDQRTRAVIEGAAASPGSDPVSTKIGRRRAAQALSRQDRGDPEPGRPRQGVRRGDDARHRRADRRGRAAGPQG